MTLILPQIGAFHAAGGGGEVDTIAYDANLNVLASVSGDIPSSWFQDNNSVRYLSIGTGCSVIGSSAFRGSGLIGSPEGGLIIPENVALASLCFDNANLQGNLKLSAGVTSSFTTFRSNNLSGIDLTEWTSSNISTDVFNGAATRIASSLVLPVSVTTVNKRGLWQFARFTQQRDIYASSIEAAGWTSGCLDYSNANVWVPSARYADYDAAWVSRVSRADDNVTVSEWTNYPAIPN